MNFGPYASSAESHQILDTALDNGINYIDTSNVYGEREGEGWTEQIIGRWIARSTQQRERVVLATKLYGRMGPGPNEMYLSAISIKHQCEASLRRLNTDYIDVYQMHHIDRSAPWEELWEAFDILKNQGKILYVGSSNFPAWQIAKANERADAMNSFGLVSEQSIYNLLVRTTELEVGPACREYGVAFNPWSPLAGGLLGGAVAREDTRRTIDSRAEQRHARHRDALGAYEKLCDELGHAPAEVALAWLLAQRGVTSPIIGPRSVPQLMSALQATTITLDSDTLARLDALFPGPGGPAPEAYAW
jgi:aryl-alcohol dehydrogenase-like predicted oxidoreductase